MNPINTLNIIIQQMQYYEFIHYLKEHNLYCKQINNMLLIFAEYNYTTNAFQQYYNSLIVDISKKKIITYMYPEVKEIKYIDNMSDCEVLMEYQGVPITIFNNNNEWYVSTKKDIINNKHVIYLLYMEILEHLKYTSVTDFYETLNKDYSYYFILVHHNNKHYKNHYINLFGENYMFLYLISIKDSEINELDVYKYDISNMNNKYIKYVNKINFENVTKIFNNTYISSVILKKYNPNIKMYDYYRYTNYNFLHNKYKNTNDFIYYMFLYCNNKLHYGYFIEINNIKYNTRTIMRELFNHLIYETTYLYYTVCAYNNYLLEEKTIEYLDLPRIYKFLLYKIKKNYNYITLSQKKYYNETVFNLKSLFTSLNINLIIDILIARKEMSIFNDIYNNLYKINNIKINNIIDTYIL